MTRLETAGDPDELARFEAGDVSPEQFDHEAHVRVAWLMLGETDLDDCLRRYPRALRRITERLGVPEKFHATLTGFLLLLIAERRANLPDAGWLAFRAANPDLLTASGDLLRRHYSPDRLASALARRQFLAPDLGQTSAAAG